MYKFVELKGPSYSIYNCLTKRRECAVKSKTIKNDTVMVLKIDNQPELGHISLSRQGAKVVSSRVRGGQKVPDKVQIGKYEVNMNEMEYPGWFHGDIQKMAHISQFIKYENIGDNLVFLEHKNPSDYDEADFIITPYLKTSNDKCHVPHDGECYKNRIILNNDFGVCLELFNNKDIREYITETEDTKECGIFGCDRLGSKKFSDKKYICDSCLNKICERFKYVKENTDVINKKIVSRKL